MLRGDYFIAFSLEPYSIKLSKTENFHKNKFKKVVQNG